jgi:hypothetical protein
MKNIKSMLHRTVIFPVVLCGCGAWSLTFREKHRLRVFKNKVPRKISGPKRDGVRGKDYMTRSFMICTSS